MVFEEPQQTQGMTSPRSDEDMDTYRALNAAKETKRGGETDPNVKLVDLNNLPKQLPKQEKHKSSTPNRYTSVPPKKLTQKRLSNR